MCLSSSSWLDEPEYLFGLLHTHTHIHLWQTYLILTWWDIPDPYLRSGLSQIFTIINSNWWWVLSDNSNIHSGQVITKHPALGGSEWWVPVMRHSSLRDLSPWPTMTFRVTLRNESMQTDHEWSSNKWDAHLNKCIIDCTQQANLSHQGKHITWWHHIGINVKSHLHLPDDQYNKLNLLPNKP